MSLAENGEIITESFSNLFENTIRSLGFKASKHFQENYKLKNPVEIAINPFTRSRYPTWLKKIQLAFCNPYGGAKTISKESFPYVT